MPLPTLLYPPPPPHPLNVLVVSIYANKNTLPFSNQNILKSYKMRKVKNHLTNTALKSRRQKY